MAVSLTYKITKESSKTSTIRIKENDFGDGYKQRVIDGINYELDEWFLDFVPLDTTSAIALEKLLKESVTDTSKVISWTPPGETLKYWVAKEITKMNIGGKWWKITCILSRDFSLI